jgi:hypothetical protein
MADKITIQWFTTTGSYPQIIHEHEYNATGRVITCEEFVDVNWQAARGLDTGDTAGVNSQDMNGAIKPFLLRVTTFFHLRTCCTYGMCIR